MIEIKNTKVKLYTVEEFKKNYNLSVLIPEIERILRLSVFKRIILISQLAMIGPHPRYIAAIPTNDSYELVIISSEVIKEVIVDGLVPSEPITYDVRIESGDDKPPLGIAPKKFYEEMANVSRINDLWEALHRYVVEGCKIPPEWIDELKERYKMVEES